jgi:glycosyltransferase involved in cell wall biosynthesis
MTMAISVNARFRFNAITGVERYATEVCQRIGTSAIELKPRQRLAGARGHAWEQLVLPARAGSTLLWSPCNTGPLATRRQVVTIHDMSAIDHPEWMSPRFAAWYGFLLPRLARRCRKILTDSEFSRGRIVDLCGVSASKVVAIHLAASEQFRPQPAGRIRSVCERFGLEPGRYLLSVSSIEPRKNIGGILKAWLRALPSLPADVKLVLAGKSDHRIFANAGLVGLPPRVFMTGYIGQEDLPALYCGAASFIYLSFYEGFGLPPLEAMACGTPAIVSDRASLPEVVGRAGTVVSPNDADMAAAAIVAAFSSVAGEQLKSSVLAQAALFSWEKTAEKTLSVLQGAS